MSACDLWTALENAEFGVAEQMSVGLSGLDIFFILFYFYAGSIEGKC